MGSKNRTALRNRLEYAAFVLTRGAARRLGSRSLCRLGAALGEVFHVVDRRRRAIARFNLKLAFPELSQRERDRLAREVARHFGCVTLDMLRLRSVAPAELLAHVQVDGEEHLKRALSLNRGVIFMSAHVGYWEVAALIAGLRLPDGLAVVNRPLDNPLLERELDSFRSRFGNIALGKKRVLRAMLERLRGGKAVGLLIDQRSKPQAGLLVPFFDQPAWTHAILARLMLRTNAPLVPLWGFWEGPGRYSVRFDPALVADEIDGSDCNETSLTMRLNQVIETVIRERPNQWLWFHDRWQSIRLGLDQQQIIATDDDRPTPQG
ncbi:MAG: lysophospholipid acyltransferase family protein [bacterium]|nr:lysophospholipid acyltransferase family protein [bacterium]